ncbi:hypothetical protein ACFOW6_10720 [Fodinicurvata halophila]|uniref:SH3 domain-containing protein n=1 Tax=Fodinicurvata halophila TaxID=1419723 RepID=A0ABV8UN61_9PROT
MITRISRFAARWGLAALFVTTGVPMGQAQLDGHGPDAWQVTGVAVNDELNMRMGPGTDYPVIRAFPHDAAGLQQVTCVPFITFEQSVAMSDAERKNLPPRWCLMSDADRATHGWVAGRFLMEDQTPQVEATQTSDDPVASAVALVEKLYARHDQYMRGQSSSPFESPVAHEFFFAGDIPQIAASVRDAGADPLYNAQDTDISGLAIMPDPDTPVLRGMITVQAAYSNFGQPQTVEFNLRPDTARDGAPIRIMRVQHDDWMLP